MLNRPVLVPFLVLLGLLPLLPAPVGASEDPSLVDSTEPGVHVEQRSLPSTLDNPPGVSRALWASGKHRRLYQLGDWKTAFASTLHAHDLDSGAVITAPLDPPAWNSVYYAAGYDQTAALDEDGGRIFVAYAGGNGLPTSRPPSAPDYAEGQVCASPPALGSGCLAGFHVLDMATLQPKGERILFRGLRADALSPTAHGLRALRYVAPGPGQAGGKLLMVTEDVTTTPNEENHQDAALGTATNGRAVYTLNYLVQFDVETGAQEWGVRLDNCRYPVEPQNAIKGKKPVRESPNPMAVFKSWRPDGSAHIYVGCSGPSQQGLIVRIPLDAQGVPYPLPVTNNGELPSASDEPDSSVVPVAPTPQAEVASGPAKTYGFVADPGSDRMLLRVIDRGSEVWWVFDGRRSQFVGTVGIGAYDHVEGNVTAARARLDERTGRLYVVAPGNDNARAAIYLVDIRRSPLPQAQAFDHNLAQVVGVPAVESGEGTGPSHLYVRDGDQIRSFIDTVPVTVDPANNDPYAGRTLDLEEASGATQVALDGAARGYGLRAIFMTGADALTRGAGPLEPLGTVRGVQEYSNEDDVPHLAPIAPPPEACSDTDRELIVGAVGAGAPAVVDAAGARGSAEPVIVDSATRADLEAPASRCANQDWNELWSAALLGNSPMAEPSVDWPFGTRPAECLSGSEDGTDSVGDPVAGTFAAGVNCSDEEAGGFSYLRGISVGDLSATEALSSFRIYRDPTRGIVSRVESVTRGIGVAGVLRVDTVRGTAESWANGRRQPVDAEAREPGYNPNCDLERTAGTCFRRHLFGVWTPEWSCGPCGDEATLVERVGRGMGSYGSIRLRQPNATLAVGAENGFTAAIQKPEGERFADMVLNNDLLQTVLPTLEVIRDAPAGTRFHADLGRGRRGRQVYQFAGVEVSSSYGIACLLVYDEATNTCAAPSEVPGSIQVSLSDSDGKPLAGGGFEVRADVDADGVLGLKDTLLPEGACVTAEDGIGTCTFENLQPGTYLVSQVAAPPGYAKTAEPWVSQVASGEQRTVAFTNVSNVSTIDLKATDEHGAPIPGATFAAYADADSDGKVAPDAQPAAECTTDDQGVCTMKVPAGSYVLVQTGAPGGLEGIEPVPFTFASGGQVASVSVVNYPPGAPAHPEAPALPVYTPPVDYAPPAEMLEDYTPVPDVPVIVEPPAVSVPERIGGTVTQVIRAPGDALRLLARDPKQAVAWTAALALFCLTAMAVRRRQQAMALLEQ